MRRANRASIALAAALAVSLLTTADMAKAVEVAAYVMDYHGGDGTIRIRRGEKLMLSVAIGLPLEAGDLVEVVAGAKSGTAFFVSFDDGSALRRVEAGSLPIRVAQPGTVRLTVGKWRQVMEIIDWTAKSGFVSSRTRDGNEIRSAPLETAEVKLYDGARTLHLEWSGGTAPFRWEVSNNGAAVAAGSASDVRSLALPVKLSPGTALLKVTDAGKGGAARSRSFPLKVLSMPKAAEASGDRATTPLQRIAAAVELARLEGGAYMFEAVQQLSTGYATRAEIALRTAMQIGETP